MHLELDATIIIQQRHVQLPARVVWSSATSAPILSMVQSSDGVSSLCLISKRLMQWLVETQTGLNRQGMDLTSKRPHLRSDWPSWKVARKDPTPCLDC